MSKQQHNWRFVWWYAWHDIFSPSARQTTRVALSTVFVICALAVASFDLVLGYQTIKDDRLRGDPLALSLWIGQSAVQGAELNSQRLAQLTGLLQKRFLRDVPEVHPFFRVELPFVGNDERHPELALQGRTVAKDDQIALRLFRHSGLAPDKPGLIVTRRLLEYLQMGTKTHPTSVVLNTFEKKPLSVPILGIFERTLPDYHYFVISELEFERLDGAVNEPEAMVLRTGPVGRDWPKHAELRDNANVRNLLSSHGVDLPHLVRGDDNLDHWELVAKHPLRKKTWEDILKKFGDQMQKIGNVSGGFGRFDLRDAPRPLGRDYDFAEVRVAEPADLRPAAKVCREIGYPAAEDMVEQFEAIANVARQLMFVLILVIAILGANGCYAIGAVQELRAQQKLPEIGMLKAMGMSTATLRNIFLAEAIVLWGLGASAGALVGAASGVWIGTFLLLESGESWVVLLKMLPLIIAGTMIVANVATVTSMYLGTRRARASSPIESLRN